MMTAMAISVVIATLDRENDLAECLRALIRADNGLLHEVIVVDDGSRPAIRVDPALTGAARVTLLRNDRRRGASASRNRAAGVATGDVLGFVDDDARVLPNWFDVAAAELTPDRAAITGRVMPFDSGVVSRARQWRYDQRYQRLAPGTPVSFLAGGNSLVRREAFLAAGGFPDQPTAADNALVPRLHEAGGQCCFVPELGVLHRNGKGLAIAVREAWRAGTVSPAPVDRALAGMVGTLRTLPAAEPDVALVNGVLQVVNTLGQLIGSSRRAA
jgi:GT2 family glycosyltransferase